MLPSSWQPVLFQMPRSDSAWPRCDHMIVVVCSNLHARPRSRRSVCGACKTSGRPRKEEVLYMPSSTTGKERRQTLGESVGSIHYYPTYEDGQTCPAPRSTEQSETSGTRTA